MASSPTTTTRATTLVLGGTGNTGRRLVEQLLIFCVIISTFQTCCDDFSRFQLRVYCTCVQYSTTNEFFTYTPRTRMIRVHRTRACIFFCCSTLCNRILNKQTHFNSQLFRVRYQYIRKHDLRVARADTNNRKVHLQEVFDEGASIVGGSLEKDDNNIMQATE